MTVSSCYLSNHVFDLINFTIIFLFLIFLKIWHGSQSLQKRSHSSYIFGQSTFSLLINIHPFSCFKMCFCWFMCSIKKINYHSFFENYFIWSNFICTFLLSSNTQNVWNTILGSLYPFSCFLTTSYFLLQLNLYEDIVLSVMNKSTKMKLEIELFQVNSSDI